MRVFAHYDSTGAIHALVGVNAPDGVEAMVSAEPGLLITEVEGIELQPDPEDTEALREFVESHQVVIRPVAPAQVVKRDYRR